MGNAQQEERASIKKEIFRGFAVLALILVLADTAFAAKIYLKGGKVIEGEIVSSDALYVTVKDPSSGLIAIARENILKIEPPLEENKEAVEAPAVVPPPAAAKKDAIQIGLKLRGGLNTINGGDFNKNIQGRNSYFEDLNDYYGQNRYTTNWKELKSLLNFGGEAVLRIMNNFGIGLGLESLSKKHPGTIVYNYNPTNRRNYSTYYVDLVDSDKETWTYEHTIQVIPLTLSLYGFFPFGKIGEAYVLLGPGFYLGTFQQDYTVNEDYDYVDTYYYNSGKYWDTWKNVGKSQVTNHYETTSNAVGFHFGAGFNVNLMKGVALFGEALYRMATFKDWQGDYSEDSTDSYQSGWASTGYKNTTEKWSDSWKGGIWYYDYKSASTGKTYPWLGSFESEPSVSSTMSNIRKAEFNINGIVLAIGVKIFFDLL